MPDEATQVQRVPIGRPLTEDDLAALEGRWIPANVALAANIRRVSLNEGQDLLGRNKGNFAGLYVPYFKPGAAHEHYFRIRRDTPDLEVVAGNVQKESRKYIGPPGGNRIYFSFSTTPEQCQDVALDTMIVEGEFKALAAQRLSLHGSPDKRFLAIGLGGVWNWKGVIGKAGGPGGERLAVHGAIADLDLLQWKARRVIIAFDSDVASNHSVMAARRELSKELRSRGASVGFYEWPEDEGKGLDDHILKIGPDAAIEEMAGVKFDTDAGWRAELLRTKDGVPKGCLENAIVALRLAPELAGVVGYNVFSYRTAMMKPAPWVTPRWHTEGTDWTSIDDQMVAAWLQRAGIMVNTTTAGEAAEVVGREHLFHPVHAYFAGLVWDGTPRLDSWLATHLGCPNDEYHQAVGAKWLISAVARIFCPGCKADACLILEGPQGAGKSKALATIAGEWFTDEVAELGSKDAALQTRGVLIIEIAELESMSKADVGKIKAFMSRAVDRFRPPYGRHLIDSPRQCVFAGSVNHSEYLRDETGGRRFWPVRCGQINVDALRDARDQLWAEAVVRFKSGERHYLDTRELERLAAVQQAERFDEPVWQELIAAWLEKPTMKFDRDGHPVAEMTSDTDSVSMTDVLVHCIGKVPGQWSQADKNSVGRSLRALGWQPYRQRAGGRLEWRYRKDGVCCDGA